jgi:hypothetical protein
MAATAASRLREQLSDQSGESVGLPLGIAIGRMVCPFT